MRMYIHIIYIYIYIYIYTRGNIEALRVKGILYMVFVCCMYWLDRHYTIQANSSQRIILVLGHPWPSAGLWPPKPTRHKVSVPEPGYCAMEIDGLQDAERLDHLQGCAVHFPGWG